MIVSTSFSLKAAVTSSISTACTTKSRGRQPLQSSACRSNAIRYTKARYDQIADTKARYDQIHKLQVRPGSLYILGRNRYRQARYDRNRKARYDQVASTKTRCDQIYYTKALIRYTTSRYDQEAYIF